MSQPICHVLSIMSLCYVPTSLIKKKKKKLLISTFNQNVSSSIAVGALQQETVKSSFVTLVDPAVRTQNEKKQELANCCFLNPV